MRDFYEEVSEKMKMKPIRLQSDQEFIQYEIKNLNTKYNVQMFSTNVRCGKAFAAKIIRELKRRIFILKTRQMKGKAYHLNPLK